MYTLMFTGLEANATYLVRLYGRNSFGESDDIEFEFETPAGKRHFLNLFILIQTN